MTAGIPSLSKSGFAEPLTLSEFLVSIERLMTLIFSSTFFACPKKVAKKGHLAGALLSADFACE